MTYRLRRKFRRSCFLFSLRLLKLSMTALASDGPNVLFPALLWAWIASMRSLVRPSWRKKMRCPRPHNGAVLNSSPLACPWRMSSASPGPMLWSRRSEKRLTGWLARAATVESPVVSVGVGQSAHPTLTNSERPLVMEVAPPGVSADGVGGARNRWKKANFSIALNPSGVVVTEVSVTLLGTVTNWHFGFCSRSCWNSSLVIPISTLYASPENSSRVWFWAFQPNLAIVPSLPLLFVVPVIVRPHTTP